MACFLSLLYMASRVRVLVFVEFAYWLFLMYSSTPGPSGGRGDTPRWGADGCVLCLLYDVYQMLSLSSVPV